MAHPLLTNKTVWLQPGLVITYGSNIDATSHRHHAIQIVWPKAGTTFTLFNQEIDSLVIIGSLVEHQIQMNEGWIILVEQQSGFGHALEAKLNGQSHQRFDSSFSAFESATSTKDLAQLLAPLLAALQLPTHFLPLNARTGMDMRIQKLLSELDHCFINGCIKPKSWRASQVATQLALSESRFLHLFSEQVGVTWRAYLLWRRMMCAIDAIKNDHSATEAAYLAGFSDSAHLSRTFKKTFGITIRQSLTMFGIS